METRYINTDLDLESGFDLSPLTDALESLGVFPLQVLRTEERGWISALETTTEYKDPETNITAMLDAIDALNEEMTALWKKCSLRDFDIGYECGEEPHYIRNNLSLNTIQRIAQAGAELRITLYGLRIQRETETEESVSE